MTTVNKQAHLHNVGRLRTV